MSALLMNINEARLNPPREAINMKETIETSSQNPILRHEITCLRSHTELATQTAKRAAGIGWAEVSVVLRIHGARGP